MKIYHTHIFNPVSATQAVFLKNHYLVLDDAGKIVWIGEPKNCPYKEAEILDYQKFLIIPGLIDNHVHLPQFDARGKYGKELLDWLKTYIFPTEAKFKDPQVARETAQRFFAALLQNGTTLACVYHTVFPEAVDIAFEEAEKAGIKIIMGKMMMDQNSPTELLETTESSLYESEQLCKKWHRKGGKLWYAFSPRFAPTCTETLMKEAARLATENDAYIQTHVNENLQEKAWVRELFPDAKNYLDVYFRNGLLGPKTILGHVIHMEPAEWEVLQETGAKVSHCPDSNFFLSSGHFPLTEMEQREIPFGLGSDVGAGTTLNMFHIMKMMQYIQMKPLHPFALFYSATLGNSKVLSMEKETGSLEVGKDGDFVVLSSPDLDPAFDFTSATPEEIASFLVYRGDDRLVREVFVQGKKVFSK